MTKLYNAVYGFILTLLTITTAQATPIEINTGSEVFGGLLLEGSSTTPVAISATQEWIMNIDSYFDSAAIASTHNDTIHKQLTDL